MNKLKDIQQLINERAEHKLRSDLEKFRKYLHSELAMGLIDIGAQISVEINGKKENLRNALWSTDSSIFKMLKEDQLPKYIESETKNFLNKVDSIREDVDELMNNKPEEY